MLHGSIPTFGSLGAVRPAAAVRQVRQPGVLHRRLEDLPAVQTLDGPEVAAQILHRLDVVLLLRGEDGVEGLQLRAEEGGTLAPPTHAENSDPDGKTGTIWGQEEGKTLVHRCPAINRSKPTFSPRPGGTLSFSRPGDTWKKGRSYQQCGCRSGDRKRRRPGAPNGRKDRRVLGVRQDSVNQSAASGVQHNDGHHASFTVAVIVCAAPVWLLPPCRLAHSPQRQMGHYENSPTMTQTHPRGRFRVVFTQHYS